MHFIRRLQHVLAIQKNRLKYILSVIHELQFESQKLDSAKKRLVTALDALHLHLGKRKDNDEDYLNKINDALGTADDISQWPKNPVSFAMPAYV